MIERIPFLRLVFPNSIENKYVIHKDCASEMFNKINELVDHVNQLEIALQKTKKQNDNYSDVIKAFNKFGKEFSKELVIEKEPKFGEWVSVIEKQPTKTGSYVFSFGGELVIAFYKAEIKEIEMPSGFALSVDEAKGCPISIHWMPLPEPPKRRG